MTFSDLSRSFQRKVLQTTTEQKRYQTEIRAHTEAVFKAASTLGRRNIGSSNRRNLKMLAFQLFENDGVKIIM